MSPRKYLARERELKDEFEAQVLACNVCHLKGDHDCELALPLQAHHLIRQQVIRAHTSTLTDEETWALLWDPALGVPLCDRVHQQITSRFRTFPRSRVPARAWTAAEKHEVKHLLERELTSKLW